MVLQFNDPLKNSRIDDKISLLKRQEEEELAQMLSSRYGIKYADLTNVSINTNALRIIPEENARKAKIAAFDILNKKIHLAIQSPNKIETQNEIKDLESRGYLVELFLVSIKSLEKAWTLYKDISFAVESKAGTLEVSSEEIEKFINDVQSIDDARKLILNIMSMNKGFRISRIVEIVIAAAIATGSSDIHVEPEDNNVRLRFRIDGILIEVTLFDDETYRLLLSRIKLLSGLKLNIKNSAQDGRFSVRIGAREIEIRSSILPGNNGESIVMRLLDPNSLTTPIHELGVSEKLLKIFLKEVDKPNGMILNTGPTGSGKTTTLYSFLNKVKNPGIKIITIEDPIEYHLAGIVQTQVDAKKGYDFASGLRASLRQDPDVLMVGEIRDLETAETAIHASLTGHLVFSTLHTNTAAGAYPRLIDLGVNSKILTSAINMVIAQRLVRKLCPHCHQEINLEGEDLNLVKNIYDSIKDPKKPPFTGKSFKAIGCDKCNGTGYKGRVGIFEVVLNSSKLEDIVQDNPSEREIKKLMQEEGQLDMAQDGVWKIVIGMTTLEEVTRVVDLVRREGKDVV
jgi:type II secretory ATPase GspE/PulE/Tfp pilus assembly ATPase PilB-like protein